MDNQRQKKIDESLEKYRKGEISLDDYIKVCKENAENKDIENKESLYNREIYRNNILSFKDKEIIEDYSEDEIYRQIESYLKETLDLADLNTDIIGIQLIGSRTKGTNKESSDLDVLIEYNNSDLKEDNLFNLLNEIEEPLIINGVRVDFNPITEERSGYTIKSWLEENYDYNKYLEEEEEDEL